MHRLVIALTSLLVVAGVVAIGLFVFVLGAVSDRAAALAPADTVAYVNVYLQPSSAQQSRLGALVGRLPGFADTAALDEKIDQVAQNLLSSAGVDYRGQLKPWLGDQLAVAAWPGSEDDPVVVALVGVKDREAAEAALAEVADERGLGEPRREEHRGVAIDVTAETSWAFVDELLVIAPTVDGVEAVIDVDAGAPSLAEGDAFAEAMRELPSDHLAAVFLDLPRVGELAGTDATPTGWGAAGAVLVAEEEGLRLEGSAPFEDERSSDSAAGASTLAGWMPDGTQAEVTIFGLRSLIEDAEALAGETDEGQELTDALAAARAIAAFGLGIDIDADLLPLLEGPVALAVADVGGAIPSVQLLLEPADPDAAAATLERVADGLAGTGAAVTREQIGDRAEAIVVSVPGTVEIAYAVVDGVVIAGLSVEDVAAAISAHDDGQSLAASERYARTFALAGDRAGHELYVDVGGILAALEATDELPADARDILHEIGTFALTATPRDERLEFRAAVTVD